MFRRLQFTIPEGAIFIFCVDQKLLTLEEIMDSLKPFDGDSFVSQSRFDAYAAGHRFPFSFLPIFGQVFAKCPPPSKRKFLLCLDTLLGIVVLWKRMEWPGVWKFAPVTNPQSRFKTLSIESNPRLK